MENQRVLTLRGLVGGGTNAILGGRKKIRARFKPGGEGTQNAQANRTGPRSPYKPGNVRGHNADGKE